MGNRNAPGCGQILAACALVIFGTFGGCIVGAAPGFPNHTDDRLVTLGVVGGLIVGAILAALFLLRPRILRAGALALFCALGGNIIGGGIYGIVTGDPSGDQEGSGFLAQVIGTVGGLIIGAMLAARALRRRDE